LTRFECTCGNRLYFHNTQCVSCGREVGWCPACAGLTALEPLDGGGYRCGNAACGATLNKCLNYAEAQVCNRCVAMEDGSGSALCEYCRLTEVIPDLTVAGNREKWQKLEQAKRRLLYSLDLLGLPYTGVSPPLSFDFKSDVEPPDGWSFEFGGERVYTGHANGKITINIREADPVEREKARVWFGEAQRTLIGHFRHEIGHYYWDVLVAGQREDAFKRVFGDHEQPPYAAAIQRYHEQGPAPDWPARCISPYASMHPWEDFAETFSTYLDMASVLRVASEMDMEPGAVLMSLEISDAVERYVKVGVTINEFNRSMGLSDLVPEVFVPPVVDKLRFVDGLVRNAGGAGT